MKSFYILMFTACVLTACKNETHSVESANEEITEDIAENKVPTYASFGEKIDAENVNSASQIAGKFTEMKPGDTLHTKWRATVDEVCQAKGCWMKLDLGDQKQAMVKFKDYGFFVPKNIADKDVILSGKAYVTEVSVEEQKHYAEDAGKSKEEIAAITEPKLTYSFLADGVLVVEE